MESGHTIDADPVRTCASDISTHLVQELGNINNMRLLGCILDNCPAFCHGSGQHHIDRGADAHYVQIDLGSLKGRFAGLRIILCICIDETVLNTDLCAQQFKALLVLVDRTGTDLAAARKRYTGLFVFTQHRTDQIIGSSDLMNIVVVDHEFTDALAVDLNDMGIILFRKAHHGADGFYSFQEYTDIVDIRQIADRHGLIAHDRCRQDAKSGILRPADLNVTDERIPTLDDILFHKLHLKYCVCIYSHGH